MGRYNVAKLDALADAFEQGDRERQAEAFRKIHKLRNACWYAGLMLTLIVFLILRLG